LNQIFKSLHAESADIDLAFAVDDLLRMRLGVVTYSARSLSTTSRKVQTCLTLLIAWRHAG